MDAAFLYACQRVLLASRPGYTYCTTPDAYADAKSLVLSISYPTLDFMLLQLRKDVVSQRQIHPLAVS